MYHILYQMGYKVQITGKRLRFLGLSLLVSVCAAAHTAEGTDTSDVAAQTVQAPQPAKPAGNTSKGLLFFYRLSDRVDRFLRQGIDTNYIDLPEHSWRLAYTNAMIGVNSRISSTSSEPVVGNGDVTLFNKTTPSVDLGFYAGYRGFGFGYSWDAIHAYAQRLSFSLGSKSLGLDFSIHTSTNIQTSLVAGEWSIPNLTKNNVVITNANLNLWYALNSAHYSHQAAVKQSYIQKKTAGSLLLHLSYMSSQVSLSDTLKIPDMQLPLLPTLMSDMTAIRTRQIAVGIGYGINYTPNHGKVVLHASAAAMLVTYTVNLVSFYLPDSIAEGLPDEPMYNLRPSFPVHVTGNVRAAASWEINRWVHLSAWATGENIRFRSAITANQNRIFLSNWDWKVQLSVGVRFGAGYERRNRALEAAGELPQQVLRQPRPNKLPQWLTDFFYSPKL
ncbi:MAG: DUF4421 family protein [Paludibacteraceae bacterium]|nr:DUF4421 family protein [Paludibacteraceae bacterium]